MLCIEQFHCCRSCLDPVYCKKVDFRGMRSKICSDHVSVFCVAVVGAIVSHTDAGFDRRLQVHTVATHVTSKVSLQARHNWTAVSAFH